MRWRIPNGSVIGTGDNGQARSADRKPSLVPMPMAPPAERKPAGTRRNGLVRIGTAADRHVRHPSEMLEGEPGISGKSTQPRCPGVGITPVERRRGAGR